MRFEEWGWHDRFLPMALHTTLRTVHIQVKQQKINCLLHTMLWRESVEGTESCDFRKCIPALFPSLRVSVYCMWNGVEASASSKWIYQNPLNNFNDSIAFWMADEAMDFPLKFWWTIHENIPLNFELGYAFNQLAAIFRYTYTFPVSVTKLSQPPHAYTQSVSSSKWNISPFWSNSIAMRTHSSYVAT